MSAHIEESRQGKTKCTQGAWGTGGNARRSGTGQGEGKPVK